MESHNKIEKLDLGAQFSVPNYIKVVDQTPSGATSITFLIQNGPRKEVGENGADIDVIGRTWLAILKEFNRQFPCEENNSSIRHIEFALSAQTQRLKRRLAQNLEGRNLEKAGVKPIS